MITISFKIMGKNWKLKVLKNRKYAKKNGTDSVGITKGWKREICLPVLGTDLETIVHELVHAYLTEMCVNGAELSVEVLEEVYAELMSKRGKELLQLGDELYAEVKDLLQPKLTCVQDLRVEKVKRKK